MLFWLVLEEAGLSITGEKYESPIGMRGPGEEPCGPVCKDNGSGGFRGKRGGAWRTMPAMDCEDSPVVERERRLVLDPFLVLSIPKPC